LELIGMQQYDDKLEPVRYQTQVMMAYVYGDEVVTSPRGVGTSFALNRISLAEQATTV
jgi:hypothetical protein